MDFTDELYQEVILSHNKKPKNFREMDDATSSCHGHNPLCGDDYTVYVKVNDEDIIEDVSFNGTGCAISKSSSSLMTQHLKGKTSKEAKIIFEEFHQMVTGEFDPNKEDHHLGKLAIFQGVKKFPIRAKCATLAWHSVKGALDSEVDISTE